jgi:hypothetical protein
MDAKQGGNVLSYMPTVSCLVLVHSSTRLSVRTCLLCTLRVRPSVRLSVQCLATLCLPQWLHWAVNCLDLSTSYVTALAGREGAPEDASYLPAGLSVRTSVQQVLDQEPGKPVLHKTKHKWGGRGACTNLFFLAELLGLLFHRLPLLSRVKRRRVKTVADRR